MRAIYSNYDDWIKHFTDNPKTTDECWTPPDVYGAVVSFVLKKTGRKAAEIVRPFFPGGDYVHTEYPEGCIVIDNPPFSMFKKITGFYTENGIQFFLFGPGLTIGNASGNLVITGAQITYENGANVPTEFATNLPCFPKISTAPDLGEAIERCRSQDKKANLKAYEYPEEVLSISDLRTIAGGGVYFEAGEAEPINSLEDVRLFGGRWLISKAKAQAKAQAQAKRILQLSEAQKRIVERLNGRENEK